MKLWYIAHTFTILSLLMAILGAIFISPYILVSLVSTILIYKNAEDIRKKESLK